MLCDYTIFRGRNSLSYSVQTGRMSLDVHTNVTKVRQNFEFYVKFDAHFCEKDFDSFYLYHSSCAPV